MSVGVARGLVLVLAASLASGGAAQAAPAKKAAPLLEPPMEVHVVRSAHPDCEPDCLQWIAAQGRIDGSSLARFKKVLAKLGDRKLPILVDSAGGSVSGAIAIGRLIRAKGLDVIVTGTVFTPCAAGDSACRKRKAGGELRGLPQASRSKCASSCAFVLAGGVRRFAGAGTLVGVHQITMIMHKYRVETRRGYNVVETKKTLISVKKIGQDSAPTKDAYGNIRSFLADMGVSADLMPMMMSTPAERMHWLTHVELRATRLATHFFNGEQLLNPQAATKATAAPARGAEQFLGLCSGSLARQWAAACAESGGRDGDAAAGVSAEPGPSAPSEGEK